MSRPRPTPKGESAISVSTLAHQLGFCPKTVRVWANAKIIPGAAKVGGEWRFPADSAARMMGVRRKTS